MSTKSDITPSLPSEDTTDQKKASEASIENIMILLNNLVNEQRLNNTAIQTSLENLRINNDITNHILENLKLHATEHNTTLYDAKENIENIDKRLTSVENIVLKDLAHKSTGVPKLCTYFITFTSSYGVVGLYGNPRMADLPLFYQMLPLLSFIRVVTLDLICPLVLQTVSNIYENM